MSLVLSLYIYVVYVIVWYYMSNNRKATTGHYHLGLAWSICIRKSISGFTSARVFDLSYKTRTVNAFVTWTQMNVSCMCIYRCAYVCTCVCRCVCVCVYVYTSLARVVDGTNVCIYLRSQLSTLFRPGVRQWFKASCVLINVHFGCAEWTQCLLSSTVYINTCSMCMKKISSNA